MTRSASLWFGCLCLLLVGAGCSGTGAKVRRAPGFDVHMLEREGLLCAGVTALGGGAYPPGETASGRFEAALKERRPTVKFVGLEAFGKSLGAARYQSLAKSYSDDERIPEGIWEAASASDHPAYFLWVNVSADKSDRRVSQDKKVTFRTVEDSEGNRTRVVDSVEYLTTSRASRFVEAEFAVYEAATRQRMWHAVISGSDFNSSSRRDSFAYPAPARVDPPGAFEVLEAIIVRAVKELTAK